MKDLKISPSITPRETQNISRYFNDISSSTPLSPEQEVELAYRVQSGDLGARNELVIANLRFVISVAKQYQHMGADLEDLINEGNIGLIKAAEAFDPTKGFKFATYAVWWIRQSILGFIAEKAQIVRLPQNVTNQHCRIYNFSINFEEEHHRAPSLEEIAQVLDITEERLKDYLYCANCTTSLDAPCSSDTDTTMGEMIPDTVSHSTDNRLVRESMRHDIQVALNSVSEREQTILRLYFGLDGESLSMDMIAMEMHLTRERVRQLIEKATATIRRIHSKALLQYA